MSRSGRAITAMAAALLLALLPVTTARAADSAGERIAKALRESPVYVDAAYAAAVPPVRERQLARQIARTGLPIRVVLVPLAKGDAFDGDADTLAAVVRDRLPQRDLILITTDGDFTDSLNGYEWPADTHQTADAVAAAGFLDETQDAGLADLTSKAVELVAEGDGTKAYEEATRDLGERAAPPKPRERESRWPMAAAGLAVLTALIVLLLVRRRRRRTASPQVFTTARAADEAAVRARASSEVMALASAVQAADVAATPGLRPALDAYEAAGKVLDAARGVPDLAGVLALVAEGEDALAGASDALPLCFFNPLHGRATGRKTWRPLGRRERAKMAVCTACAAALRAHRSPEVLTDGASVPYFEVTGSVWAATGYGSLLRGEDSLAGRVARGDFTRSVLSD